MMKVIRWLDRMCAELKYALFVRLKTRIDMKKLCVSALVKLRFCLALVIAIPLWFAAKIAVNRKFKAALAGAAVWLLYGDKVKLLVGDGDAGNVASE